jgi:hypothetical protein
MNVVIQHGKVVVVAPPGQSAVLSAQQTRQLSTALAKAASLAPDATPLTPCEPTGFDTTELTPTGLTPTEPTPTGCTPTEFTPTDTHRRPSGFGDHASSRTPD